MKNSETSTCLISVGRQRTGLFSVKYWNSRGYDILSSNFQPVLAIKIQKLAEWPWGISPTLYSHDHHSTAPEDLQRQSHSKPAHHPLMEHIDGRHVALLVPPSIGAVWSIVPWKVKNGYPSARSAGSQAPTSRKSPVSCQAPLTTDNPATRLLTVALRAITAASSLPLDLLLA